MGIAIPNKIGFGNMPPVFQARIYGAHPTRRPLPQTSSNRRRYIKDILRRSEIKRLYVYRLHKMHG